MPDLVSSSPLDFIGFINTTDEGKAYNVDSIDRFNRLKDIFKDWSGGDNFWTNIEDEYQRYLDNFNNARDLSSLDENTVLDFVKNYAQGSYSDLDPGAVNTLINYYMTEKSNNSARDFDSRVNQIMVEDLKKAGLNPALLGSNPQGMISVTGSSYAGNSNLTTSARDKANLKYKYKALSIKQALGATAIVVNGLGKVFSSVAKLV